MAVNIQYKVYETVLMNGYNEQKITTSQTRKINKITEYEFDGNKVTQPNGETWNQTTFAMHWMTITAIKIDNIKITDLYSFASTNKELENNKLARWNKVIIPNEYLYSKIKDLIQKGMYYYNENNFTLENIDNRTSDFKISINIDKIPTFLNDLITNSI